MDLQKTKTYDLLHRYFVIRKRLRTDFFYLSYILHYDKLAFVKSPHHATAINSYLHSFRFNCIEFPRETFKTTAFTVVDTVQDVINDPNIRILIGHFAGANARAMLDEIQNHFITNESIRFGFPEIVPVNTKRPETGDWCGDSIRVHRTRQYKESTIHALGSDQTMASYHFDKIKFDDLVVEQSTTTVDQIAKADGFLRKSYSLLNNHNPRSTLSLVGTQWAPDDTMIKVEKEQILAPDGKPFHLFKVPDVNIVGDTRIANFPDILSIETLAGLEISQGPIVYSAFYKLDSVEVLGALWNKSMINWYDELPDDRIFKMVGCVDPSLSEKENKNNCDTVAAIIATDQFNELWILEYKLSKGVKVLYDDIFELWKKWKEARRTVKKPKTGILVSETIGDLSFFSIETTLFQKLLVKELDRQMRERDCFIPIREDQPLTDKIKRIMILDPLINRRAMHLKRGMTELESQIIRFGRPNTKVDILDAISQGYKQMGLRSVKKRSNDRQKEYDEMWASASIV